MMVSLALAHIGRARLKRAAELRNFQRVMDLGHEVFGLWESTVRRAFETGVIANSVTRSGSKSSTESSQ